MSKQKVDVEGILNTLALMRQKIPQLAARPKKKVSDTADLTSFVPADEAALEQFEMETLAVALESFAGELSASVEEAQQKAMSDAMEIYYAAEELAKDPEHAHLVPYVEQMRAIYRRDFGVDIPKRK